ncbi:MAG: heavy metal translocating P-type ATPase [Chromatiales bacterium]|nr:heavy metal translocating P-type ATPase [Chromatiales bacterium]
MTNSCFHCGLPVSPTAPFNAVVDGAERNFCCLGCESVCKAIYDAGLEGFYQRTPEGTLLSPPPEPPKDLDIYDLEEVQEEFIDIKSGEHGEVRSIHLLVEGIHCAACVWLIERSLQPMAGVLKASVNLSGKRLHLEWDNDLIKLSDILQKLSLIGYAAVPFDPEAAEGEIKKANRSMLFRMAFSGFTMMNLLWISIALYSGADKGEFREMFHWVGFALATPTLFYAGWPFLKGAYTGLRSLHLGMDLPIAIGASVTWGYSSYITFTQSTQGEVYFDTVVNFIFVILVGRFLEAISKRHAVAATQRLMDLQPRVATVLRDGEEKVVPIRSVKVDEIVVVKPGYKIPVDGIISDGESRIDESMLSGESNPVTKAIGDHVSAGTMNALNPILITVSGTLKDTALGRIIRLVEEAQASKAPIQCTADRIVPWFVATTLLLAISAFSYWLFIADAGIEMALMTATAVLIITCPCAFGLATPMAIAVASGQGARHGILVKNGAVLETLSSINHFVFDKTGTLTEGKMHLVEINAVETINKQKLLTQIAAIEQRSEHPIARAIVLEALSQNIIFQNQKISGLQYLSGHGIKGIVDGQKISLGQLKWLESEGIASDQILTERAEVLEQQATTPIHVAIDGQHVALLGITDSLRADAQKMINSLKHDQITTTLLSGDRRKVANAVAAQLGGMEVIAEVRPEEKHQIIKELQQRGEQVAMVGDGINDAPALIQANVGIAIGSGTDVSIESADIVLMDDELDKIHQAAALSRRTLKAIRQNIGISIIYNIIMVPLAVSGFITPLVAAISMPISSLLVIGNAARIRTLFNKKS